MALRCRQLVKHYGTVKAVDGLDLDVHSGECLGLLGPNGAGKTTTVEILEGLTEPTSGIVEVLGQRWHQGHDHALRARIGVQLQETQLETKLTVLETVRLFRSFYDRGRDVADVIAALELDEKRGARIEALSGGQRQRVALACALVSDPEVLFLDEPTTGLDPQARLKIWEVIEGFRKSGGTILLTTHYMEEATRLCDRVAIVDRGRVVACDTPAALIATLGVGQLVELELDGDSLDASEFAGVAGLGDVTRAADGRWTLAMEAGTSAIHEVLAVLDRQGVRLRTLVTHQATLEDVFVHLTGRALRDE